MRNRSDPWNRMCPDCDTIFASVQSKGVCPSCQLVFDVEKNGTLIHRRYRIGDESSPPLSPQESATQLISKFVRVLNAGKITTNEFQFNVLLHFANIPKSCWCDCAAAIPRDLAADFRDYVAAYLVPVDFMPSPTPFMVDTRSETAIKNKKRELRPKYVSLHKFWQSQC